MTTSGGEKTWTGKKSYLSLYVSAYILGQERQLTSLMTKAKKNQDLVIKVLFETLNIQIIN